MYFLLIWEWFILEDHSLIQLQEVSLKSFLDSDIWIILWILTEKEEGLVRYHPVLPLSPFSSITKTFSVAHGSAKLLSVPSSYESKCFILIAGYGSDFFVGTVTPSNGFDTLATDFNHPALITLISGLFVGVFTLRALFLRTSLKRIWNWSDSVYK